MLKCSICNVQFNRPFDMNRHNLTKKHIQNYENSSNEDIEIYNKQLEEFKKIKQKQKEKKELKEKQEEKQKEKQEEKQEEKQYHCEYCNKSYKSEYHYNKHLETKKHKLNISKPFKNIIDVRIPVIHRETRRIKYGKNAPLSSRLSYFLRENPEYDIYTKYNLNSSLILTIKDELSRLLKLIEN